MGIEIDEGAANAVLDVILRAQIGTVRLDAVRRAYLGDRGPTAPRCVAAVRRIEEVIAPIDRDRPLAADVRRAAELLDRLTDA